MRNNAKPHVQHSRDTRMPGRMMSARASPALPPRPEQNTRTCSRRHRRYWGCPRSGARNGPPLIVAVNASI
ncbi:hypothetical protein APY04_0488 [Hyphomicrobium sulfonivorans]|uniref:Uncharacterized protein n=1 Tax=Hyphomicrobium sulfonivorans TaxID=121290 RepID=A0A109BM45_HYPSL|nr:hypothetical protein APY04_0488 [Hyphomicrobium sulfonivorans]